MHGQITGFCHIFSNNIRAQFTKFHFKLDQLRYDSVSIKNPKFQQIELLLLEEPSNYRSIIWTAFRVVSKLSLVIRF
jgi:hypothetical protein